MTSNFHARKESVVNVDYSDNAKHLHIAARIIAKSFEFNHAPELMEEHFSLLVKEKSAHVNQGKQNNCRNKYTFLRKTYNVFSSGEILTK